MRGQRLFIRPIESEDRDTIDSFLKAQGKEHSVSACGLLGKLVGDLVAVLTIEITPEAVRVEQLVVKNELRRKRIGRAMLDELERFARKMDRERLIAEPGQAREFFRRSGFTDEGETWMVRRVR